MALSDEENKARARERNRKWYAENKERKIEAGRKYRAENREELREYDRKRYADNPKRSDKYKDTPKGHVTRLLSAARTSGTAKYNLDGHRDELLDIVRDGRCHDSGVPFDLSRAGVSVCGTPWNLPSLDRREAGGDYTWDNVRVVLWAVNQMRCDMSIPMFHALCHVLSENLTKRYGAPDLSVLLSDQQKETDSEDTP